MLLFLVVRVLSKLNVLPQILIFRVVHFQKIVTGSAQGNPLELVSMLENWMALRLPTVI